MAELSSFRLHPGDGAPEFALPDTEGVTHRLSDLREPWLVVAFWCNHCPYVLAWESRMVELGRTYGPRGVGFVLINSNDATAYPADGLDGMRARVREHRYPFPYLRDETQEVARAYGALVTPHPMLFDADRRLVFQGRIDDSHDRPERVQHRYLADALDRVLAGGRPSVPELPVLGCTIKWRP